MTFIDLSKAFNESTGPPETLSKSRSPEQVINSLRFIRRKHHFPNSVLNFNKVIHFLSHRPNPGVQIICTTDWTLNRFKVKTKSFQIFTMELQYVDSSTITVHTEDLQYLILDGFGKA